MSYIIFDLDQTLLNNESIVTDYTKAVLEALRAEGHKIVINTARSDMMTRELMERIEPDFTLLCAGAGILDRTGKYVFRCEIPAETAKAISLELAAEGRLFSMQGHPYLYTNNPDFTRYDTRPFAPNDFTYDFGVPKFIANLGCDGDAAAAYYAEKYDLNVTKYFDGPLYRFCAREATKAKGDAVLVSMNGDTLSDVIAFGDDHGDLDMLLEAGVGVALKNGVDAVKKKVKYVTEYTNDEDGVARFLVKHFGLDIKE